MNKLKNMRDEDLILLFAKGKSEAFGVLIERHNSFIKDSLYSKLKNRELSEDCTQETWVRAMESISAGKYKDTGKFKSWLLRISSNLAIDHFRKVKRNPSIINYIHSPYGGGLETVDMVKDNRNNGEETLILNQSKENVRAMLDKLPEDLKNVVILRLYADLSFKEIAQLTNCSINTCLGRMRYGLINLRKMMQLPQAS